MLAHFHAQYGNFWINYSLNICTALQYEIYENNLLYGTAFIVQHSSVLWL